MEPVYIEICSFCPVLFLLERVGHVTTLTALTKPLAPIFPVLLVIPVCSSPRSFPWLHSYFPPYPRRTGQLTFFRSGHVRFSHLPTPVFKTFLFSSCQPLIFPRPGRLEHLEAFFFGYSNAIRADRQRTTSDCG